MESETPSILSQLTAVADQPQMLHALMVHAPILFAMLGPIILAIGWFLPKNRTLGFSALATYVALTLTAWLAEESGEKATELVPNSLPEQYWNAINQHSEMAEKIWIFGLVTAIFAGISLVNAKGVQWTAKTIALILGVVTAAWVGVTGHYGGTLVYEYGIGTPALTVETHKATSQSIDSSKSDDSESPHAAAPDEDRPPVVYAKDIRPILDTYCVSCHNPSDAEGEYDMSTPDSLVSGGKKAGRSIISGDPGKSPLYQYISGSLQPRMPKEELPLSDAQIATVHQWILEGALFDTTTSADGLAVAMTVPGSEENTKEMEASSSDSENEEAEGDILSYARLLDLRYKHLREAGSVPRKNSDPSSQFHLLERDHERRFNHTLRMQYLAPVEDPPYELDEHPIDAFMIAWWNENGHEAEWNLCDDRTFLRRVYIDVIGKYPTWNEYNQFTSNEDPNKREQIIDELLARNEDYATNWLPFWEDALCSNTEAPSKFDWHGNFEPFLWDFLTKNRPYDELVINMIDLNEKPKEFKFNYIIRKDHDYVTQSVANAAQVFMGESFRCSKCHNHFDNRPNTQTRFLGFASYFSFAPLELIRCEKPTGQKVQPKFPYDLPGIDAQPNGNMTSRSEEVAKLIVDPTNPRFASTFVNRLWKRYLGVGLYEPVDDYRTDTQPSVPDLFAWLADDFKLNGYDIKQTIRLILTSKTYQQSYNEMTADSFDAENPGETRLFRSPQLRRLSGEQYIDSVRVALGYTAEGFDRASFKDVPNFIGRTLGIQATRNEVVTVRDHQPTMILALEFLNGPDVDFLLKSSPAVEYFKNEKKSRKLDELISEVYMVVLNRVPTDEEIRYAQEFFVELRNTPDGKLGLQKKFFMDLYWTLISGPEFLYVL